MSLPGTDPVQKITVIPRGIAALGYTMQVPTEDRFLMSKTELENKIATLLGGRAAEEIVFGDISTGAHNDLSRATDIARSMVKEYGMSKVGQVYYASNRRAQFLSPHPGGHRGVQRGDRRGDRRGDQRDHQRPVRAGRSRSCKGQRAASWSRRSASCSIRKPSRAPSSRRSWPRSPVRTTARPPQPA
ncbi:MAG: hypothetical protein MZV70_71775 [Desulfobacterales bacterium]|nr:hypothetical protein [Desulfobacterales bacterium]